MLLANAAYTPSSTPSAENGGILASPADISIERIQRSIHVSEFGLVTIHENITVRNISPFPLNGCELCHPQTHVKNIAYLMAHDYDNDTQLKISESYVRKRITYHALFFVNVVEPGDSYMFKLTTTYADCVKLDKDRSYYTHVLDLDVPIYPMSPYLITQADIRVEFFDLLDIPQAIYTYSPHAEYIKDEVLYYEFSDIKPYEISRLLVTYYSELPPAVFTSARRTLDFDPWGYLHVTEEQTLKNIGMEASYINQLDFFVPTDAINVRAHDDLGNLTLFLFQPDDDYEGPPLEQLNGTVLTRTRLTGNHSYTFTLKYTLNLENHTRIENGKHILTTELYTLMNIQIDSLDIELVMPEGCRLDENHVCNTTDSYLDYTRRVHRLKTDERAAAVNTELSLSIYVPIISMTMRPMYISLFIAIVALVFTSLRFADQVILPKTPPIPREVRQTVERFCNLYEHRIAYRIDMGLLSRQKRLREIEKDRYIRERGKLTYELDKIESELEIVKAEMLLLGEEYKNIITTIEQKEEKRTKAKEMTITALKSFKGNDIRKTVFNKIVREQRSKIRTADKEIDRILLALREEYL